MAKGFTPIIGLAVVVALAMAAVFGAMSLTPSPAYAQAVDMTVEIVEGEKEWVVFTDEVENYPDSVGRDTSAGAFDVVITPSTDANDPNTGTIVRLPSATEVDHVDLGIRDAAIEIEAIDGQAGKTGRVTITLVDDGPDTTFAGNHTVTIAVDVIEPDDSTPATRIRRISDLQIEQAPSGSAGNESDELDLTDFFVDGTGPKGMIKDYTITYTSDQLQVSDETEDPATSDWTAAASTMTSLTTKDGTVVFRAADGASSESSVYVTVEANDTLGGSGNDNPEDDFFVEIVEDPQSRGDLPSFAPDSTSPGSNTIYKVKFKTAATKHVNTLTSDLVIEFHEDYGIPSSIDTSSVTVLVEDSDTDAPDRTPAGTITPVDYTFNPSHVDVDGEKVVISLGNMNVEDKARDHLVGGGSTIEVVIRKSAGVSNPSEAGDYNLVAIEFGGGIKDEYDDDKETPSNFRKAQEFHRPQDIPQ